ncbi:MAG: lysophospholipid acyltransferase family protein [Paludibacter sp.]
MIKANHSYFGELFFKYYSKIKLKNHFQNIKFEGEIKDLGQAILVISNHFSWWDGFIQLQLNNRFFKRKFHVMMLEEQLLKFKILNKGGAFSVQKNSRDIINSLNYSVEILNDKNNLLLMFPQGEIQSLYTDNYIFENGLGYLLKNRKTDIQLIFNINLVDYFSESKPTLTIYFKEFIYDCNTNFKDIELDFNKFTSDCKFKQVK